MTGIKHALMSASGSARWLRCPASVKYSQQFENKTSVHAIEGTLAHELADLALSAGVPAIEYAGSQLENGIITASMCEYVQDYIDYIHDHMTDKAILTSEQRVYFDNVVHGGFGTLDASIIDKTNGVIHIFDLKYGQGVAVSAIGNSQGRLYALGLLNDDKKIKGINKFIIHIAQVRRNSFTSEELTITELVKYGEYVKARALLCLEDNPTLTAGAVQCQFCNARNNCKALKNKVEADLLGSFSDLSTADSMDDNRLSELEKRQILDASPLITSFLKGIKTDVENELLAGGSFTGYKLVAGRSVRRWCVGAGDELKKIIGDKAYRKPQLIGITDAYKLMDKSDVNALLVKPEGKPTLAKSDDKRGNIDIIGDFKTLT